MTVDSFYFIEVHAISQIDPTYFFQYESIGLPTLVPWVTYYDETGTFITRQVITTEYTVTYGGQPPIYQRGEVIILDTELTLPGTDTTLYFLRKTPIIQELDLIPYTSTPTESLEFGLDRLTFILQEIEGNKCGCPGGGANQEPPPVNEWPGIHPPVSGPEPNPYSYPDQPCTLLYGASRYSAGAAIGNDSDWSTLLPYIPEGENTVSYSSANPGPAWPYPVGNLSVLEAFNGGVLSLTREFPLTPECAEYSGTTIANAVYWSGAGNPQGLSGSMVISCLPGYNQTAGVANLRWRAGTGVAQFDVSIAYGGSDRTFRLKIAGPFGNVWSDFFTIVYADNEGFHPLLINISWRVIEAIPGVATGSMSMTAGVVDQGASVTFNIATYPTDAIDIGSSDSWWSIGSLVTLGRLNLWSSVSAVDYDFTQEQLDNINESNNLNEGY